MARRDVDVVVVGGGPVGLAFAAEAVARNLAVTVLAGRDAPWTPTYGMWADEAAALGLDDVVAGRWGDVDVVTTQGETVSFGRGYVRLARRRFRDRLLQAIVAGGGQVHHQTAANVRHDADGSEVEDVEGLVYRARIVVDASGPRPALLEPRTAPRSFQTAVGLQVEVDAHPFPLDRFRLMDWRAVPGHDGPPTFLYAMPLGSHRLFVEETSLLGAARPFPELRGRLLARLAHLGVRVREVVDTELCHIPLDDGLPSRDQRVVGLGAAASMVHPATGYQLGRSLRAARRVADVIARQPHGAPGALAAKAWRAVWPASALASRELFLYGARRVAQLDGAQNSAFFRAFVQSDPAARDAYLAGDAGLAPVLATMASTFAGAPAPVRSTLLRGGHTLPGRLLSASLGLPSRVGAIG